MTNTATALRRCTEAIHAAAQGKVLDLSDMSASSLLATLREHVQLGETFDTIIWVSETETTSGLNNLPETLPEMLTAVLASDGWLWMVEPMPSRWSHAYWRRSRLGSSSLVAALWAGGLAVTDVRRFKAAGTSRGNYVELRARHATTSTSSTSTSPITGDADSRGRAELS